MSLVKGDRVKLTAYAIKRFIRPGKEKVLGAIATNRSRSRISYMVLWDDRKTAESLHESFIEKAKP